MKKTNENTSTARMKRVYGLVSKVHEKDFRVGGLIRRVGGFVCLISLRKRRILLFISDGVKEGLPLSAR